MRGGMPIVPDRSQAGCTVVTCKTSNRIWRKIFQAPLQELLLSLFTISGPIYSLSVGLKVLQTYHPKFSLCQFDTVGVDPWIHEFSSWLDIKGVGSFPFRKMLSVGVPFFFFQLNIRFHKTSVQPVTENLIPAKSTK